MIPSYVTSTYYILAALAVVAVLIRVVYSFFRDFDNAKRFTSDMASIHLPYIYDCMNRIANKLDIELGKTPPVNFSTSRPNPS